jgi:hypothetical protein
MRYGLPIRPVYDPYTEPYTDIRYGSPPIGANPYVSTGRKDKVKEFSRLCIGGGSLGQPLCAAAAHSDQRICRSLRATRLRRWLHTAVSQKNESTAPAESVWAVLLLFAVTWCCAHSPPVGAGPETVLFALGICSSKGPISTFPFTQPCAP